MPTLVNPLPAQGRSEGAVKGRTPTDLMAGPQNYPAQTFIARTRHCALLAQ